MASNFEKVTEAPNKSNKKVYDNMKSVDADSKLHEEINRKRTHESINKVPKLTDQKRKHLEKNLLAARHDKLLFEEVKEEASFRQELSDLLSN